MLGPPVLLNQEPQLRSSENTPVLQTGYLAVAILRNCLNALGKTGTWKRAKNDLFTGLGLPDSLLLDGTRGALTQGGPLI